MTYTPVHNRFWSDGWVRQLNALDRYLFLYLLTNGRARLTGIYELPLDLMASECGIDEKDLRISMLQRLEPKVYYREGWVIITNYTKHQVGGGHKYLQGVKANYEELPAKIKEIAKDYGYPIHTLSIPYQHFPNRIEENRIDNTGELRSRTLVVEEDCPSELRRESDDSKSPRISGDKKKAYDELIAWSEKERDFKFPKTSITKQYRAFKLANQNGFTRIQLMEKWEEMAMDKFWQKTGFDWMNVVQQLSIKPL